MSEINTGGAAFPINHQVDANDNVTCYAEFGMTLRDHFAAKAMASLIGEGEWNKTGGLRLSVVEAIAQGAYVYADAMLKARG